jgi:hypothetical protein
MLFMQTNWKLSSNLTFNLQQCTITNKRKGAKEAGWMAREEREKSRMCRAV